MSEYLSSIHSAILRKRGNVLSTLIALPFGTVPPSLYSVIDKIRTVDLSAFCGSKFDVHTSNYVKCGLLAMNSLVDRDFERAYRHQLSAFNSVLEFFGNKEENTNWIIPALSRASKDLRLIAQKVDEEKDDQTCKLSRESLNALTRGFAMISKDKAPLGPQSKKLALLAITNDLFKIYFKLNTIQLCAKLIGSIEGPGGVMDSYREFSVSDVVMYKYYIGRIRMFEDKFEEARDALRFALRYTPSNNGTNIRKILALLVPIEMTLGVMPGDCISTTYGFPEYVEIGQALKDGNVAAFDSLLSTFRSEFVKIGVYLVLEQTRTIALRNMFRKVYILTNNHRINLKVIESIFHWLGQKTSLDEIECYLTNLIFQGKIKGYISHEKRFLVVSRADPFPTSVIVKPFVTNA